MPIPHFPPAVAASSLDYELSPYERLILGPPDRDDSIGVGMFGVFRLRATFPECGAVMLGAVAAIAALAHSLVG